MEVLGKNYPVRIAAPGNTETGHSFFSSRIFPRSCMDLPEDGELEKIYHQHLLILNLFEYLVKSLFLVYY